MFKVLFTIACTVPLMMGASFVPAQAQAQSKPVNNKSPGKAEQRTIDFHCDQALGHLSLVPKLEVHGFANRGVRKDVGATFGKVVVSVPGDQLLCFEPNRRLLDHPELLGKISPSGIDMLVLDSKSMDDNENERCDNLMPFVPHLSTLKQLFVDKSDVSDAGIAHLKWMKSLEGISASFTSVSGASLAVLATLPELRSIRLWAVKTTDADLKNLQRMPKLRHLNLNHAVLTRSGIEQLSKCKTLKELHLDFNSNVDDESLKVLSHMSTLEWLNLRRTAVTDQGVASLASLKHLQYLDLRRDKVTVAGLEPLAPLHLRCLVLSERGYSSKQIDALRKICPAVVLAPDKGEAVDSTTQRIFAPVFIPKDR